MLLWQPRIRCPDRTAGECAGEQEGTGWAPEAVADPRFEPRRELSETDVEPGWFDPRHRGIEAVMWRGDASFVHPIEERLREGCVFVPALLVERGDGVMELIGADVATDRPPPPCVECVDGSLGGVESVVVADGS